MRKYGFNGYQAFILDSALALIFLSAMPSYIICYSKAARDTILRVINGSQTFVLALTGIKPQKILPCAVLRKRGHQIFALLSKKDE